MGIVIVTAMITVGVIITGLFVATFMEMRNKDFRQNFMSRINKNGD